MSKSASGYAAKVGGSPPVAIVPIEHFNADEWQDTFDTLKRNLMDVDNEWGVVARLTATFAQHVNHRIYADIDGELLEIELWDQA